MFLYDVVLNLIFVTFSELLSLFKLEYYQNYTGDHAAAVFCVSFYSVGCAFIFV